MIKNKTRKFMILCILIIIFLLLYFIGDFLLFHIGIYNYNAGNYKKSIKILKFQSIIHKRASSFHFIGLSYYKLDSLKAAIDSFSQAIEIEEKKNICDDGFFYRVRLNRAYTIYQCTKTECDTCIDLAIRDCNVLVESFPDSLDPQFVRAKLFYKNENYEKSLFDLNKLIEKQPEIKEYYGFRTHVDYILNNYDQIFEDIKNSTYSDEGKLVILIYQGAINILKNNLEKAGLYIEELKEFIQTYNIQEDEIELLFAIYNFEIGNNIQAEYHLEKRKNIINDFAKGEKRAELLSQNKHMADKIDKMHKSLEFERY